MKTIQSPIFLLFIIISLSQCSILNSAGGGTDEKMSREYALRRDIIDYADNYTGAKYTYAGKDPGKGFDCSGFTYFVMKKYGIDLSPSSREQEKQGRSIRVKDVKPGDLIFYRRSALGRVFHVSLVYANDPDGIKVIHSTSRGVVIDNITSSSYWAPKISTARDVVSR